MAEISTTSSGFMYTRLGRTALHLACGKVHLAMVNELLSPNDSNDATTILGKRRSRGADIEATDNNGDTPLYNAILHNHLPIVKALLAVGVDCHATSNLGRLHIYFTVQFG
jgi:ankyrin repeat protein